jgi:hypothetical protein
MTNSTTRVKSGNRSTYDLTLVGLNGNGGSAVGVAMLLGREMARNPPIHRMRGRIEYAEGDGQGRNKVDGCSA